MKGHAGHSTYMGCRRGFVNKNYRSAAIAASEIKSAVGAGKVLLRSSLKLGVKAATLGAVASTDLEEVASDLASEASDLVDKHLGERFTQQKRQKDAIQAFRDALAELPSLLSDQSESGERPKPLVVIIDELDRCRPTFALEILERIKHFFSVPNVHFVIGVHLDQLRNSVILAYGPWSTIPLTPSSVAKSTTPLPSHLARLASCDHDRTSAACKEGQGHESEQGPLGKGRLHSHRCNNAREWRSTNPTVGDQ